ncbi:hypothetical protein [Candidatus Methanocrinis natronophilus]|uniref:Nickel transport protein n=1 Tax=Candidatus Methanocrinis natronophilus TaxID=3033396 RepID=A0ABT5X9Q9_9EURY|nr:hypothetical protein [Candidatus Methanocrinis natronophilus]MDF0591388.1 hypothetical protein [Candidatus Methanocrinis natronophilus]
MRRAVILVLLILVTAGMAEAHRMFVGQSVSLEIFAIYDDGEPARKADVMVYRFNATTQNYDLYQEGVTDSQGIYSMTLPGKGTGDWRYKISQHGHAEEGFLSVSTERRLPVEAGIMALALIPAALVARRVKKR